MSGVFLIFLTMKHLLLLVLALVLSGCGGGVLYYHVDEDSLNTTPNSQVVTPTENVETETVIEEVLPTDDLLPLGEPVELSNENGAVVVVQNLTERQMIASPLAIIGTARRDWFFEGSFPVTLMTLEEETVKEWYATGAWLEPLDGGDLESLSGDDMIAFETNIEFEAPGLEVDGGKIRFGKSVVGDEDTEEYVEMMVLWP